VRSSNSVGVDFLVDEKRARFLEYLVVFRGGYFADCAKNDVLFDGEKSLRPNKAWLTNFPPFAIGVIQRDGEGIPVRAARDLAQNQIRTWNLYQSNRNSSPTKSNTSH